MCDLYIVASASFEHKVGAVQQCDVFGSVAVDVIDMFCPGEVGGEGQAHKLQKR